MAEHAFLKEWKKENISMIKLVHPEWDEDKIEKCLNKIIDDEIKNPECALVNNYINKSAKTTMLDLYDYIVKTKPIIAGGGVLFKNHHESINPPAIFLDGALKKRKSIKKQLKKFPAGSYQYATIDRKQLTEKVVANSYYGASGNESSQFYNIFTALATTATGQSLISCMMCSFESFYSNNVKFYNVSDFLLYVKNSLNKKYEYIEIKDMPAITDDLLINKFSKMFKNIMGLNTKEVIVKTIQNLNGFEKQQLYYSTYLFEFLKIKSIQNIILDIIYSVDSFKDPNSVPEIIKDRLDYLWDILKYWVVYNYPTFNRINRLKFDTRKSVVTIDTDSNMLNIRKWMEFLDTIIDKSKTIAKDDNEIMYIKCNSFCYIITKYTEIILEDYCKKANIPEEYAPRLNMKNEFLYLRMILTNKKKSYCGLVRLREGNELIPEKLDIKGIQIIKSTCPPLAKDYFMKLTREILYSDPISGSMVLKRVKEFARYIESSLLAGEKKFLNPLSVKEPEAYDKPFSNQGIRGVYVWNLIYPDKEISLPDKLTIVKVKLDKKDQIDILAKRFPDIYHKLVKGVYDNPSCSFGPKGISVVAIPSQVDTVPEWIIPFIDKDKIINDNISKFHMIMESLGIKLMDTRANNPHVTNVVTF